MSATIHSIADRAMSTLDRIDAAAADRHTRLLAGLDRLERGMDFVRLSAIREQAGRIAARHHLPDDQAAELKSLATRAYREGASAGRALQMVARVARGLSPERGGTGLDGGPEEAA